jgi:hypothetical protein
MFGEDLQIKKFPYLAYSPNIMEYFAIIGYQENFVPQILDSYKKKNNIYIPTIISSLTSNSDFGLVDNNLIIRQIFPDNPLTIPIDKNDNSQGPPPTSNVIYSFCFDTNDGKNKSLYTCYGFKFYEKYKYYITNSNFEEYYIPKAFCIISQYYYFTLFDYICRGIHSLLSQKSKVPAEITIYNIINFIPSPINYGLHLDLFSYSLEVPDIEVGQLSGYPYLDFDLSEIFNLLPLNLILEIYFVTIIERHVIFFSSNLELLNMVMFIMYVLNYPCNDSTYFWHIVSVSKSNFVEENQFVGRLFNCTLGVNTTYNEEIDTSIFGKFYRYIADIDNKKIYLINGDLSEEEREFQEFNVLKELTSYVQNIIREKDKNNDSLFLKPFIERLKKNLDFILSKNPEYTSNPKNKYVNFFKSSKQIIEKNKKIQELFYDFNLNILMIFYQDNSLNSSYDKIIRDKPEDALKRLYKLRNASESIKMNKNEENFCELYRNTIKYRMYFENYILNFESVDLYKIPYLFTEEFINIKMADQSNKIINKLSLFNIIDSLYNSSNQQTIINITLNNIFGDYNMKLKSKFKCFYNSDNLNNVPQLMVLNKKIINKYMNLLYNYYQKEELKDLFPSMRIQEDDPIKNIDRRYIINIIQNTLEQKNFIDLSNYLIFSLVYLFSISLPLHPYLKMIDYLQKIISSLAKTKIFMRQHIYIIVKSLYKFYFIHKNQHIYPEINVSCLRMNYYMLTNFLNQNMLVPNEEMMKIFNHFFTKIILQERESLSKKKVESFTTIKEQLTYITIMKNCFTSKKMFKPKTMINAAMKENNNCNIYIRGGKKQLQPKIMIKINDYIYTAEFFAPKKVYKLIQVTFNDFFDNAGLDMSKLKIKNVRDVLVNLIQYGLELNKVNEIIPISFLIDTLYLFKDYEKKYGN